MILGKKSVILARKKGGSGRIRPLRFFGDGSGGEAVGDCAPVNDIPESIDIIGATVLVVEVVGMLPDIKPK